MSIEKTKQEYDIWGTVIMFENGIYQQAENRGKTSDQ